MASGARAQGVATAALVFAVTVAAAWFGDGLNPWWPLMWFAPLPVLWFALRRSGWQAAAVAFLAWLVASLNMLGYFRALGIPFAGWLGTYAGVALLFTAALLLFRALVLRGSLWSGVLGFPALWVSGEFVRAHASVHGTAGSLAYTQLKCLPVLQLASVTGPYGISFLLLLFPAALAAGLHWRKQAPRKAGRVIAAVAGVIAAVVVFGTVRLALPAPGDRVTVGLVASDEPANVDVTAAGTDTERLLQVYAAAAMDLARRGAQVIVLPEKLGVVADGAGKGADALFAKLADATGVTLVVGEVRVSPPFRYNQARIYQPAARVLSYNKHHLLPPFESPLKAGTTLALLPEERGTWAVSICKDLDFTRLSRRYGQAGTGLMLVPAWDFAMDRVWHGHMAVMRGVEDGFSMARAAKQGYLTVSDDRGRILAEKRSDAAPFATLLATVPAGHQQTLFLLLGEWFGWLSVGMLGFCLAQLCRRRAAQGPSSR